MNGVIISAFDTCVQRVNLLREYYEKKGHQITYIASDFSHVSKSKHQIKESDIQIPTLAYKKNLSVARLRSHYGFAKDVYHTIDNLQPDFIHCLIPPNALVASLAKYKGNHDNVKLFFDVIDVWPETMPIKSFKSFFPFRVWKQMRDDHLNQADVIFTECELFQTVLPESCQPKMKTLFWSREEMPLDMPLHLSEEEMHFCYLGAINNIIDIDRISSFLGACQKHKPTVLHIIGHGESKETLIQEVKKNNVSVIDHGSIYEQEQKQEIFNLCHYGLNVMKDSVVVGLSMKSLDYMCGQLPLINTIGGDTHVLCQKTQLGYNIDDSSIQQIAKAVCEETTEENKRHREIVKEIYLSHFCKDSFFETLDSVPLFD